MNIDQTLIKKLQRLSMLNINDEQEKQTITELQDILNFTENLNSLDVSSVEEIHFNPTQGYSPLREDTDKNKDISEDILKNAPSSENNFFVVPNIIE